MSPARFLPEPPEEAGDFFAATAEGRLLIQKCTACSKLQHYPRKICIHCGSAELDNIEASGKGSVHTYTVVHRGFPGFGDDGPYVAAIIDLEEGVRMTSNVIGCAPDDVSIGMPVEVTFIEEGAEDNRLTLPRFKPVA